MGNISVDAQTVAKAIELCNKSINEFNKAVNTLKKQYQTAGSTWNDGKYKQLGGIVNDCSTALSKPVKQLEECIKKLTALQKAISEYEQTNIK